MLSSIDCHFRAWEASMGFAEYSNYDGLRLAELVKKKEIKPIELIEAAIERIERHNPQLNAVVFKAFDEARAMATSNLPARARQRRRRFDPHTCVVLWPRRPQANARAQSARPHDR